MKVLIYVNKEKDKDGLWLCDFIKKIQKKNLDYTVLTDDMLESEIEANALFVLGGDGTILHLTNFALQNNIPIIGINAGKLGFLNEFEKFETELAIDLLCANELKPDNRIIMQVEFHKKTYSALNDVVLQRVFSYEDACIVNVGVSLDGDSIENIIGDGVIVCTPTGSTAYSLSAGGSILAPGIDAFSLTPLAAHSLSHRPIIFSSNSSCRLNLLQGEKAVVIIDGKVIDYVTHNDIIRINKANKNITFLRKKESNFFKTLTRKMKDN